MRADPFPDRAEAGRALGRLLAGLAPRPGRLVLALPRGGVPVGFEVARALDAPLDAFVVRKLGVPGHEEYAFGAIAAGGVRVLNEEVVRMLGLDDEVVARVTRAEELELERRERAYRPGLAAPDVRGRVVVLVDDGLATGASMSAAVKALRVRGPERIVVAVPVGAAGTCSMLRRSTDQVVCAMTPEPFGSVGQWYQDFRPTSDAEVRALLALAHDRALS